MTLSKVDWTQGAIEGGSSGSGIFDSDGFLRGVLSGGSDCESHAFYGRFDVFYPHASEYLAADEPPEYNPEPEPEDAHSNARRGATRVRANSSTRGTINPAGDVDYFRVRISGDGTLTVETRGDTDTQGTLEDSSGREIASNDDGGEFAGNFSIVRQVSAGTYYVRVEGWSDTTGDYRLVVSFEEDEPEPPKPEPPKGESLRITTEATYVNQSVPSSDRDVFKVILLETNVREEGAYTFKDCTIPIGEEPADDAENVGNCRWTEFVDKGYNLKLFTFNWQDEREVGTSAVWGQFCLLNEFGQGQWVRFFTADGTSESVVGSASGPLTYEGD